MRQQNQDAVMNHHGQSGHIQRLIHRKGTIEREEGNFREGGSPKYKPKRHGLYPLEVLSWWAHKQTITTNEGPWCTSWHTILIAMTEQQKTAPNFLEAAGGFLWDNGYFSSPYQNPQRSRCPETLLISKASPYLPFTVETETLRLTIMAFRPYSWDVIQDQGFIMGSQAMASGMMACAENTSVPVTARWRVVSIRITIR